MRGKEGGNGEAQLKGEMGRKGRRTINKGKKEEREIDN